MVNKWNEVIEGSGIRYLVMEKYYKMKKRSKKLFFSCLVLLERL